LINYARTLIYTTALGHPALTSIETSLDLFEDGTASRLADQLSSLVRFFVTNLKSHLNAASVPIRLVALPESFDCYAKCLAPTLAEATSSNAATAPQSWPTPMPAPPMIPLLTPHARPLASFLSKRGLIVRPVTWPTVPKGADRVRVCLHAGNTKEDVKRLVNGVVEWTRGLMEDERAEKMRVGSWKNVSGGGGWEERAFAVGNVPVELFLQCFDVP